MKQRLLIMLTIFGAFIISNYSIKEVFLGESPKVNPYYLVNMKSKTIRTIAKLKNSVTNFAKVFRKKETPEAINNFANVGGNSIPLNLFKSFSKGVSAYDEGDGKVILKIDEGADYKETTIKLPNGQEMVIRNYTGE